MRSLRRIQFLPRRRRSQAQCSFPRRLLHPAHSTTRFSHCRPESHPVISSSGGQRSGHHTHKLPCFQREARNMLKRKGFLILVAALLVSLIGLGDNLPLSAQSTNAVAQQEPGEWTCWGDDSMNPCHNTLLDFAMTSPDNVWAVGMRGTIMHWNGASWVNVASPTGPRSQPHRCAFGR